MFSDVVVNILASSIEVAAVVAVVFFLYSLWRDTKDAFLR